jgi:ABC-type transport system substrate-binding protein
MKSKPIWSIVLIVGLLITAIAPMAMASAQDTEAQREEILKIAIPGPIQDPSNMNFIMSGGASRSNTGLHQLGYEYFFYSNLQTGEFIPWLATSYEYNADSSALTGTTASPSPPRTSSSPTTSCARTRRSPSRRRPARQCRRSKRPIP